MRREGGGGAGGRRAAVRCGRRGLAGRHGEADPAGAQLRGPGECGDAGQSLGPPLGYLLLGSSLLRAGDGAVGWRGEVSVNICKIKHAG